jgi:pyrimidine operon attenuation protein/uracil phosphoribosyltransferase
MSTALAALTEKKCGSNESHAVIGAKLAYNIVLRDVLPPIVAELEKKIAELERRLNQYQEIDIAQYFRDDLRCNLCLGVGVGCRVCMGRR